MYCLREFRRNPDRLSDYLPWARLGAPGVVINKDGSLQKTFMFRGLDLDCHTQAEVQNVILRVNNVLKRLTGGWAIYSDAQRVLSEEYPQSEFPDPISLMIDEERRMYFTSGDHYESMYFFTLVWLPPPDQEEGVANIFVDQGDAKKGSSISFFKKAKKFVLGVDDRTITEVDKARWNKHIVTFQNECDGVLRLFQECLKEARPLNDSETLTYLHSCISNSDHTVEVPRIPMYLDAVLADTPLVGGMKPMLGEEHLRVVSILSFPGESWAGMFDRLNYLNFPYRWVSRFIFMDKVDALSETNSFRRKWFGKRKGIITQLKEVCAQSESIMVDQDAIEKSNDSGAANLMIANDVVAAGYYTCSIVIKHHDKDVVADRVREIQTVINGLGFSTIDETYNAVDSWLGSLPGLCRANRRRPLIHTLNLAELLPLSASWAGPLRNKQFNDVVLMYAQTAGKTPIRVDLHGEGEVGHTMVLGPTGAGKSVLLGLLEAQFRRYPGSQVYIFDKDASSRAMTLGVGGNFYDLMSDKGVTLQFQPLANIDQESELRWAYEWLLNYLMMQLGSVSPDTKKALFASLKSLASSPKKERTISGLTFLIMDQALRDIIEQLTEKGPYGELFDSDEDTLSYGRWQGFEMSQIMNYSNVVPMALEYLFHQLEKRFVGPPTALVLDECWLFFQSEIFAEKIRDWLKTLRKKNVSVIFATQSLDDVLKSSIADAILDSCPNRFFLPNANALEDRGKELYQKFSLNDQEIKIIGEATPQRQYYYKSLKKPFGSRLIELAMGKFALQYCGASSSEDQQEIWEIVEKYGTKGFNEEWIKRRLPEYYDSFKVIEAAQNNTIQEEKPYTEISVKTVSRLSKTPSMPVAPYSQIETVIEPAAIKKEPFIQPVVVEKEPMVSASMPVGPIKEVPFVPVDLPSRSSAAILPPKLPKANVNHGGRVITIASLKEGTGKTVISSNMAVAAALGGKKVLCLEIGTSTTDLFISSPSKVATLLDYVPYFDYETLSFTKPVSSFATDTDIENLSLIAGVPVTHKDAVMREHILALLVAAQSEYDLIFVKGSGEDAVLDAALDVSDSILWVVCSDIISVRNSLNMIARKGQFLSKTQVVLNQVGVHSMDTMMIKKEFDSIKSGLVVGTVRKDVHAVEKALQQVLPISFVAGDSAISDDLSALSQTMRLPLPPAPLRKAVVGGNELQAPPQKKSGWKRFFSRNR